MTNKIAQDLSSVIRAHTESKTLEELAAQGKRRVRVVSGSKVIKLIQAIVDDSIQRGTLENAQADRDRIVSETKGQFERVLRIQQEQDEVIRQQKELAAGFRTEKEAAERRVHDLKELIETERSDNGRREGKLVGGYQERIARLEEERRDLQGRLDDARMPGEEKAELDRARLRVQELEAESALSRRQSEDLTERELVRERTITLSGSSR